MSASVSNPQLEAISELGRLNGIALQCRYIEQMQKIKLVLVHNLPKQRALGDWFEQKTNTSYMDFMSASQNCPAPAEYDQLLATAIDRLESVFKK